MGRGKRISYNGPKPRTHKNRLCSSIRASYQPNEPPPKPNAAPIKPNEDHPSRGSHQPTRLPKQLSSPRDALPYPSMQVRTERRGSNRSNDAHLIMLSNLSIGHRFEICRLDKIEEEKSYRKGGPRATRLELAKRSSKLRKTASHTGVQLPPTEHRS
jgi:hypothetical protein